MEILAQIQTQETNQVNMSSLELVDFINNYREVHEQQSSVLRHDHFMAKVPQVLGLKDAPKFRGTYQDSQNRTKPCYHFPKREACLMAMSYSYELQAQIFDRMTAMEEALKKPTLNLDDPAFLREALLGYTEKVIELEQKVQVLEPKAIALETIADTSNTYTIRECVKAIGMIREKELIQLLINKKWCYRDATQKLQPSAQYVQNGIFINRTSPVITNAYDGQERVFLHMRVTAFGLTRITGLVNKMRQRNEVAA